MITLATIPLDHLNLAVQVASDSIKKRQTGTSWEDIAIAMEPSAIAIIEAVANIFFPGVGTIIDIARRLHAMEVPQTQEQINAWMDRTSNGDLS